MFQGYCIHCLHQFFLSTDTHYSVFIPQIVIMALVTLAIIAIVLSITLTADAGSNDQFKPEGDPLTFSEFVGGWYYAKSFNGTWWSPTEIQWRDQADNLVLWNVETNESKILVASDTVGMVSSSASFVAFGKSPSLLLFRDGKESVWRHSFLAKYIVLNVNTSEATEITPKDKPKGVVLFFKNLILART